AFDELGVGDSVHESKDSYAFWGSFNMPTFSFKPLHEIFHGFPFSFLDLVDLYQILDALLLLKSSKSRIRGVKGYVSSHAHGWDSLSSSMLDFPFFDLDFQCPPLLSSLLENASISHDDVLSW
ncbi:hypothetical protein Tco_0197190, partial [Tanacetum coccineum]